MTFKHDGGQWRLKDLFVDFADNLDDGLVRYGLNKKVPGVPMLRDLYIELQDPTEIEFANKYLGGLEHWQRLQESPWMVDKIKEWRTELDLQIVSNALKAIKEEAEGNTPTSFQANKLLLSMSWRDSINKAQPDSETTKVLRRGRPKNEEIAKAAYQLANERTKADEDAKRIFGDLLPGSSPN